MTISDMKQELFDYYIRIQNQYLSNKNEEKYRIKYVIISKIYKTISSMNDEMSINSYLIEIKNNSLSYRKLYDELLPKYSKETNISIKNSIAKQLNEYAARISLYNEVYNIIKKCFVRNIKSSTTKVNNSVVKTQKSKFENEDTIISDRIIDLLEKYNDLDKNTTEAKRIIEEVYNLRVQRENKFKELYGRDYRVFISELESIENIASVSFKERFKEKELDSNEFISELRNTINAINEYYFIDVLRIKKYYKHNNDLSDGNNLNKFFKKYNNYLRKFRVLISSLFNNRQIVFKVNENDITTDDLLAYLETCNLDGDYSVYKGKFSGSFIGNEEANKKKYIETLVFLNICINSLCDLVKDKLNNRKINIVDKEMVFDDFIKKRNDKLKEIYSLKQSGSLDSKEKSYER